MALFEHVRDMKSSPKKSIVPMASQKTSGGPPMRKFHSVGVIGPVVLCALWAARLACAARLMENVTSVCRARCRPVFLRAPGFRRRMVLGKQSKCPPLTAEKKHHTNSETSFHSECHTKILLSAGACTTEIIRLRKLFNDQPAFGKTCRHRDASK